MQEIIEDKKDSPVCIQMMQTMGESYYMLYALRQSSECDDQSKPSKIGSNSKNYTDAKQAIKFLGVAYDNQLIADEDINSMHLDLAMMDCIFNVRDKPLSRCMLCRRKCGKGEKLIKSHIWPEALLRHLTGTFYGGSKQVFDTSWKGAGKLHGPGQIHFTMLCKNCENLFSKYEKAFKSLCFEKLYCNINVDSKQCSIESDEITLSMLKAPGVPKNWLYLFCLSIAFRIFIVASKGCPSTNGNFKNWYNSFTMWREILLKEGPLQCKPVPKIAFYITPVNVLEDLSPSMAKVIFSPGAGTFCAHHLHDGVTVCDDTKEFLLSSIGVVNIVVSHNNACFDFIPPECIITLDSSEFVIPSAVRRYVLFPKGIWKGYLNIAALVTERMFNIPQDKVNAPFNKAWMGEEIKFFSGVLGESFDTTGVRMNFLPAPFDKRQSLQQFINALKSCAMFKIILHVNEVDTDNDNWFSTFIIRNTKQEVYPELFAIFIFQNKGYMISVAYKLSTADLSVGDVIQANSLKAFFPQIESHFQIKMLLQVHLKKAIDKAGFTGISLFVNWLKDFK